MPAISLTALQSTQPRTVLRAHQECGVDHIAVVQKVVVPSAWVSMPLIHSWSLLILHSQSTVSRLLHVEASQTQVQKGGFTYPLDL